MLQSAIALTVSALAAASIILPGNLPEPTPHAAPRWSTRPIGLSILLVVFAIVGSSLFALLGSA